MKLNSIGKELLSDLFFTVVTTVRQTTPATRASAAITVLRTKLLQCISWTFQPSNFIKVHSIIQIRISVKYPTPQQFIHLLKTALVGGAEINKVNGQGSKLLMGK